MNEATPGRLAGPSSALSLLLVAVALVIGLGAAPDAFAQDPPAGVLIEGGEELALVLSPATRQALMAEEPSLGGNE